MMKRQSDMGLSMIELVVAMAIFALIAIMGVQSLSSMLRVRDTLVERDIETAALGRTIALLRNDLTSVVPMLFFPPARGAPQSAIRVGQPGVDLSLSTGGQPEMDGGHAVHRVEWRRDPSSQTLTRRIWTTLIPADTTAAQPDMPVMTGVTDIRVRSYWSGQGWVEGLRSQPAPSADARDGDDAGEAQEIYSDTLPLALEVTLTSADYGDITLIESLR